MTRHAGSNLGLSRNVRKAIKTAFRRVGVSIERFPPPDTLAWNLKRVIAARGISVILDVGAHEGQFARMLREAVGFDGEIISFEPFRPSFEVLHHRMHDDRAWKGHCLALGSEDGTMTFQTYSASEFNSFLVPNEYGAARYAKKLEPTGSVTVPLRRVDQIVAPTMAKVLLKADTQGFDLEVIKGADAILSGISALLVELPAKPIYVGAARLSEMVERLAEWGYEPVGFFPVSRDPDRLRVVEFDGLFLQRG